MFQVSVSQSHWLIMILTFKHQVLRGSRCSPLWVGDLLATCWLFHLQRSEAGNRIKDFLTNCENPGSRNQPLTLRDYIFSPLSSHWPKSSNYVIKFRFAQTPNTIVKHVRVVWQNEMNSTPHLLLFQAKQVDVGFRLYLPDYYSQSPKWAVKWELLWSEVRWEMLSLQG